MRDRDPLLIDANDQPLSEQRIPDEWRVNYSTRDPRQLALDVIKAFDENHELKRQMRRDRDLLVAKLLDTRKHLWRSRVSMWAMGLIVSPILSALIMKLLHWVIQ
jgi:hypothetical protein